MGWPSANYPGRSHHVLDVADCRLQPEAVTALRRAFKDWMEQFQISAYDEESGTGLIRHLYVRTNRAGRRCAAWWPTEKSCPMPLSWRDQLRRRSPPWLGWC